MKDGTRTMKPLEIDFFFSFRSPWSYLAVPRMLELQTDYTAEVNLRVVDPIYIRYNEFFDKAHEKWLPYFIVDLIRNVEYLGMPFGLPRPDPINSDLPADSPDHPVLQLNPLGIAAEALGKGVEFAREISAMVWDGTVDGWNTGDHIEKATERAGLALSAIERWIADNAARWPEELATNNAALEEHHWGVPTMVFNNEAFFGQDRIELLRWRLEKNGLQRRTEVG
jgi:2-hydroxychromene-2-carboxylate isomerase